MSGFDLLDYASVLVGLFCAGVGFWKQNTMLTFVGAFLTMSPLLGLLK